jgi:hypothetical protein
VIVIATGRIRASDAREPANRRPADGPPRGLDCYPFVESASLAVAKEVGTLAFGTSSERRWWVDG